jgi:hypothetical protein
MHLEESGIYLSCDIPAHAVTVKEKSEIYLSYGVPANAVKGKVMNIPELWHSSPGS